MNTYMIFSASDNTDNFRWRGLHGRLSYLAQGNSLLSEKLPRDMHGDMMLISSNNIGKHITPAIYDECRKRGYGAVFLDADKSIGDKGALADVAESLTRRNLSVFCPVDVADVCPYAIPVADISLSGGVLSEYLELLKRRYTRLALSLPRTSVQFDMPTLDPKGTFLSPAALAHIIDTYDVKVFYSPQMELNYCIYSLTRNTCHFILFDDAQTISRKLRLAKSMGISDIFLTYREISDIAENIML